MALPSSAGANIAISGTILLILLTTSIQINRVNTLPAFLYNFASSLSSQQTSPQPPTTQEKNNGLNNINQQVDSVANAASSPQATAVSSVPQQQQKQDVPAPLNANTDQQQLIQKAANGFQQQLSVFQSQAQKQLTGQNQKFHMLEVLSNMGKAIQQQLLSNNNGNIQIITSPALGNANNKKNEYQSIGSAPESIRAGPTAMGPVGPAPAISGNYREQGEQIRQDIVRRVGQLQQVLSSSMDIIKDKGDVIVKRLLEQLNSRLDQAKSKADKIINEPATNEMAIKTLNTINQGLHNLNNIITNIVNRFDLTASKDATASQRIAAGLAALNAPNGAERFRQQMAAFSATSSSVKPQLF